MSTPRRIRGRWVWVAALFLLSLLWLAQTATASGQWVVEGGGQPSAFSRPPSPVPSASSVVHTPSSVTRSVGDFMAADGTLQVPHEYEGSLDLAGWRGWIDEAGRLRFAPQGSREGLRPAMPAATANTFAALGGGTVGTDGTVYALAVLGSDMYVGGQFTKAGSVTVNYIARYTPATNTFSALGPSPDVGTNGLVDSITILGGDLYLGGLFTMIGALPVNHIARYNPTTNTFSALGTSTHVGTSSTVGTVLTVGDAIYLGGAFTWADEVTVNHIARYSPATNTFSPLGTSPNIGTNSTVWSMTLLGSDLYLGGLFTTAGGATVNYITRYNPTANTFSPLGTSPTVGTSDWVLTLTSLDGLLYLGGPFTTADGVTVNRIARYTPTTNTFSPLGTDPTSGTNNTVRVLTSAGGALYLGGDFTTAGGVTVNNIARYEPGRNTFGALGSSPVGVASISPPSVFTLATLDGDVYLGGAFTTAGGVTVNHIARYTVTDSGRPAAWRSGTWFLRNSLSSGLADLIFLYGLATDKPLLCDWDGNGSKTPGVFRNGAWYLRNANSGGYADVTLSFGLAGDTPICGDWNGDGVDTVGVVRGNAWYLRNSNTNGFADMTFLFGAPGDLPLVGDWNGDGTDTPGVLRDGTWYLRNSNSSGGADLVFMYGLAAGDRPIAGDWNKDLLDTIGVIRGNQWLLRNTNTAGVADTVFLYGAAGDTMLVWR
ncbi:MAG: hypothetical protein KIT87_23555 [Anaerolineae bacterium]|nr:hypothetical protein [Anaerolineae bacterium]